jgi:hypothetical protein
MMDAIYSQIMKTVYERHHRNQRSTEIANVPLSKFNDRLVSSRRYRVFASGNRVYQVQIPDSGKKHIVNLEERTCDCIRFEEYESLCTHAIVACQHKTEDPYKLFAEEYTVSTYRKTYNHFLWPFSIENLPSKAGILPPVFKNQRGRPTTKRIRKGAWKRKETKCSKCQGVGHNIRKCWFAPAINGRQQRAWERELTIDLGSSSDSGGDVQGDSSLDSDSGLGNDDELDEETQAESNLYHKQIARAWEIINRQQQEQEQEQESESELSVLASSIFNGMEGIETDRAELGDVEMGGTGGGLIHCNIQDNSQDGQDSQDDLGGCLEDTGGRVGNGIMILGAGTSPRRTRSGKVVKYRDQ